MSKHKLITIDETGKVLTLYADDLPELGKTKVFRASHVEPVNIGGGTIWVVRLAKSKQNGNLGGKYLGPDFKVDDGVVGSVSRARWFYSRAAALAAEVVFIQNHIMEGNKHG